MNEIEQLILIAFQNSSRTVHGVQNEPKKYTRKISCDQNMNGNKITLISTTSKYLLSEIPFVLTYVIPKSLYITKHLIYIIPKCIHHTFLKIIKYSSWLVFFFCFFDMLSYSLCFPLFYWNLKFSFENVQIESRLKSSECLVKIVTAHAI